MIVRALTQMSPMEPRMELIFVVVREAPSSVVQKMSENVSLTQISSGIMLETITGRRGSRFVVEFLEVRECESTSFRSHRLEYQKSCPRARTDSIHTNDLQGQGSNM